MPRHEPLAQEFEMNRSHLQSVAHRMLGSASEADDAVQEAWLRLSRSDTSDIDNLRAWLTTVVAFLAASRSGNFGALLAVLDPDVVLRADSAAVRMAAARQAVGAPKLAPELRGAPAVAESLSGRAGAAQPALIDGAPGLVWAPGGKPRAAFTFTIARHKIVRIDLIADPEYLRRLDVTLL